jgi:hypothetical protein
MDIKNKKIGGFLQIKKLTWVETRQAIKEKDN